MPLRKIFNFQRSILNIQGNPRNSADSTYILPLRKFFWIMVYLTRIEHFNAAHRLFNPAWNREENEAVFGKCANENWHGHNYDLYVTIKGEVDENTGFLFDVKKLSEIIKDHVIEKVD